MEGFIMSYTFIATNISIDYMQKQINSAAISNDGIFTSGDQVTVFGTFTQSDKYLIDSFITGGQLEFSKELKKSEVTTNTSSLIDNGFSHLLKVFPLVLDNRSNYIGIQVFGGYPYKIQTKDMDDILNITDQTAYNLFINDGFTRYRYIKDGESDLVVEIRDSTTIAEVEAIKDGRA